MNKEEIIEALGLKDVEVLESLFMIASVFNKAELVKLGKASQKKSNRVLINKYL